MESMIGVLDGIPYFEGQTCPIERPPILSTQPEYDSTQSVNSKETQMNLPQYQQRLSKATTEKEFNKVLAEYFKGSGGLSNAFINLPMDEVRRIKERLEKRTG